MTEYFKIGQYVYTAPQEPLAAATEENPNPGLVPRSIGIVRGVQDLEPPVSYLIAKGGDLSNVEWMSVENLEAMPNNGNDAQVKAHDAP